VKCLTLHCLLVCCAFSAQQPTQLAIGLLLPQNGQPITVRAALYPRTIQEGAVAITINDAPVAGCEAVAVNMSEALCPVSFSKIGSYRIGASYSGAESWAPARATETVTLNKLDPWSYVAMNPVNPVYGQGLILNALVLGAEGMSDPTGTFTFSDGGVKLVIRPVGPDGRAGLDMALTAGRHTVQAVYNGDENYLASRPATISFTVSKGIPVVAISSTPAQVDQATVVTASVTALNPTGTITFDGVPECRNIPLNAAGVARCVTTYSQLGQFPVTARYSGDSNLEPGSATMMIAVAKAVAGLYIGMAPAAPVFGQTVRVTTLVLGAPGMPPPSGVLVFSDGSQAGQSAFDGESRGSWSAVFPVGERRVTASYGGDLHYAAAQAAASFTVAKANTTLMLATTASGFAGTVSVIAPAAGAPTGSVRFYRDGTVIGTAPLISGTATLSSKETGNINAEYPGDDNCNRSVSTAAVKATPGAQVTLAADRNPATPGQVVTFTAMVVPNPGTAAAPGGSAQFSSDGTVLGTVAVAGGRAVLSTPLPAGSHTIVAAYSGDAIYPAASATLIEVISGVPAVLGLTSSVSASVFGQPVTFTAGLAAGAGTVRFSDGGTPLASAALSGGAASFTTATLAAGTHTISASWAGDANYAAASAELPYVVEKAPTATVLTLGSGAASARIAASPPGAGAPSGSVLFVNALTGAPLASATIKGSAATAVLGPITGPVGAVYAGDDNFRGSASGPASPLGAVNAASYAGDTVAAGEIVALFGPLPAGLPAVQVTDSDGKTREATVIQSGAGQAAIMMPQDLAAGRAVITAGGYSALVTIAPVAPGLFTADASGKGAPAGLDDPLEIGEDGRTLVLYGTGFRGAKNVTASIGDVQYAGAQGEFPGLDQVNLRLPPTMRGSGTVILLVTADGVAANPVTLRIR